VLKKRYVGDALYVGRIDSYGAVAPVIRGALDERSRYGPGLADIAPLVKVELKKPMNVRF